MPVLNNPLLLLVVPILLLGVLQLLCWQHFRRSIFSINKEVKELKRQLQAVTAGALGVGRRLQQTEARLSKTLDRQNRLEQKDNTSLPYTQAGKLLKMGATVEEVMEACGLSRAEASLVELMNSGEKQGS